MISLVHSSYVKLTFRVLSWLVGPFVAIYLIRFTIPLELLVLLSIMLLAVTVGMVGSYVQRLITLDPYQYKTVEECVGETRRLTMQVLFWFAGTVFSSLYFLYNFIPFLFIHLHN